MSGASERGEVATPDRDTATGSLLFDGYRRLRANPHTVVALVVTGVLVAGLNWVALHDPVPTVGYDGIQTGEFRIAFGVFVGVASRVHVPASAVVGLRAEWLAWTVGLRLLETAAVAAGGVYATAKLLDVRVSATAALRYWVVVAFLRFFPWNVTFEGGGILVGIVLVVAVAVLLVRLFALPGLVAAGRRIGPAVRQSWTDTEGAGWSLFGVVLAVGFLNHLLVSVPVAGPVGSALTAGLHAGAVAAFLRGTGTADGTESGEDPQMR